MKRPIYLIEVTDSTFGGTPPAVFPLESERTGSPMFFRSRERAERKVAVLAAADKRHGAWRAKNGIPLPEYRILQAGVA